MTHQAAALFGPFPIVAVDCQIDILCQQLIDNLPGRRTGGDGEDDRADVDTQQHHIPAD